MRSPFFLFFLFFSSISLGQELKEIRGEVLGPNGFEKIRKPLIGPCSLGCVIDWDMRASSRKEVDGSDPYAVKNLQDGDSSTAWVEGVKGSGMGERLMVEFKEALDTVDYPFYEIGVSNGYCKSRELWKKHSRVKRMLLSKNGDPILVLKFQNSYYPQVFKWPTDLLEIGNGDLVTLEIKEVYRGSEFEDTALSDIYFMGAH